MQQIIIGRSTAAPSAASISFNALQGGGSWAAVESYRGQVISAPGWLKQLTVQLASAPGAGTSLTVTLRKNNDYTALSVTISGTSTSGTDVDQVEVVAGDIVNLSASPAGTPAVGIVYWTLVFVSKNTGESLILTNGKGNSAAVSYSSLHNSESDRASTGVANDYRSVIPTPGKLKNLCVKLSAAPGSALSVDAQVAATGDDGKIMPEDGEYYTDYPYTQVGHEAARNLQFYSWYRWTGLGIPAGAIITAAYIELYKMDQTDTVLSRIFLDDQAAPAAPASAADYLGRALTTAYVDWNALLAAGWNRSPDISAPIQEVVNTFGAINTLQVLHRNNGTVGNSWRTRSWDFDPTLAAKLHVEWVMAAPKQYTVGVTVNGVSRISVTIEAPDTSASETLTEVSVVADDVVSLAITPANAPDNSPEVMAGVCFAPDTDGESLILGGGNDNLNPAAVEYNAVQPGAVDHAWDAAEANVNQLAQFCLMSKLYLLLSGAPGGVASYTFAVTSSTAKPSVSIAGAATTGNSGAEEGWVSLANIAMRATPAGGPALADAYWGMVAKYSETGPTLVPPPTPTTATPQVSAQSATEVSENKATLNGVVTSDLGVLGQVRFQWGLSTDYSMSTPWVSGYVQGITFSQKLDDLSPGTGYHFRAQFKNAQGTFSSQDAAFATPSKQIAAIVPVNVLDLMYGGF